MPKRPRIVSQAKNRPLKRVPLKWNSTYPITVNQLLRKRNEFWETSPAFEGRVEIWNALKVAAEFFEKQDYDMAQAIIDGASITLPSGTLCDCYDELGSRYQLPFYVLSRPNNVIVDQSSDSVDLQNNTSLGFRNSEERRQSQMSAYPSHISNIDSLVSSLCGCWSLFNLVNRRQTCSPHRFNLTKTGLTRKDECFVNNSNVSTSPPSPLRIRLSTGEDFRLNWCSNDFTVLDAKHQLSLLTGWPDTRQRWYLCGRALPNRVKLQDCHIPSGYIIQVVVHSPLDPESQWKHRMPTNKQNRNSPNDEAMCAISQSQSDNMSIINTLRNSPTCE